MLPHFKCFLYLVYYIGRKKTEVFLSNYKMVIPRDSDVTKNLSNFKNKVKPQVYSATLNYILNGVQDEETHLASIDFLNCIFDISIKKKAEKFIDTNTQRILSNYELRVFVETLLLSGVSKEKICSLIPVKFRVNKKFSHSDIDTYSKIFFDVESMDDIDWQMYIARLREIAEITGDPYVSSESMKKAKALRMSQNDIMIEFGLERNLNYVEMLSDIACSVYTDLKNGFQHGEKWDILKSRIATFNSIGSSFMKHSNKKVSSNPFDDLIVEMEKTDIESIPYLDYEEIEK